MTSHPTPKWLPNTLLTRLILAMALLMMAVMMGFAAFTAYRDQQNLMANIEQQTAAVASQLLASSTNYLITDNYAEMEELAMRFLDSPSVEAIYILDSQLSPLVAVRKTHEDKIRLSKLDDYQPVLPETLDKPYLDRGKMEIWRRIEIGRPLGWIHVEYSLNEYRQRMLATWFNSALAVLIAIVLVVLTVIPIFRHNIRLLKQATAFANRLGEGQGRELQSSGLAREIQDLVLALNHASRELHNRELAVQQGQHLLQTIHRLQSGFIAEQEVHELFSEMLERLLELTGSEYGFIAEVLYQDNGQPYMKTHAISNIAWNSQTQSLYAEKAGVGFEFYNLNTLFGEVILTATPMITNDPASHPKSAGVPTGHPPLKAFMGLPFFSGSEMVGLIGVANRPGGYDLELLEFLKPLLSTFGQIIGAYRNAERRSKTEQRLKNSENMLRQVLNTIPTRVYWKNLDGVYQGCNYNFAQDAGFSGETEVVGKNDYEMPWSSEATAYRADDRQVINSGIPKMKYVEPQTNAEGDLVWLRTNKIPLRDVNDEVIGILGSYDDITIEKEKEEQLRDSESRLADAQRIAHVGNWETDFIEGVDVWSDETFRILGLEPQQEEASMERFMEAVHPEDRERVVELVAKQNTHQQPYEYECRLLLPDGSERTVFVRTEFEANRGGAVVRIYGTIQDITERKRVEKMKDEFISTVSHELRTPLTSIMGSLGLVRNMLDSADPEKIANLLAIAHNNTERLLFLINDILDISKIESGRISFHFKPVDVVQMIQDALANNESYKNDIQLEFVESPDRVVWVNADRDRILQVLYNLLSNAAKFSRPGGRVEVGVKEQGDEVEIFVRDFGVGIPDEFRSRIFEKFTQADSSDTRHAGGTGLGLSISKSIIERHHGNIRFDSETGVGTTFYIALPRQQVQVKALAGAVNGPRVLICEDEPDIAELMRQMLENEGYRCDVANSANQALSMLKQRRYEAMTLDIMLPGKDGITFLRQLREQPEFDGLEVIIVSVKADEVHRELEGTALGIHDWLSKPIDQSRLLAAMQHVTSRPDGEHPRILHVEDDQDLVQVVQSMLHEVAHVEAAPSLRQARELLQHGSYDLILLDINLPDGSGLEIIDRMKQQNIDTPVVIFSSEDVGSDTVEQVKAVLQKTRVDNEQLLHTIQAYIGRENDVGAA
jgi:PAS domain S-box-containing protein